MNDAVIYFRKSAKYFLQNPGLKTLATSLKYYGQWREHIQPGRNSMEDRIPWLTFSAIDAIKKIITPGMIIFEYGSGGSTLFWSDRVQKVISLEHNREWYAKVKDELAKQGTTNVDYYLIEGEADAGFAQKDIASPEDYISRDENYKGKNFEAYVKKIVEFPDNHFDIVLVDGRARPSCILHSIKKVKVNGYIILDNSERPYYFKRNQLDDQYWKRTDYGGPAPYISHFTQTTLFKKLKAF